MGLILKDEQGDIEIDGKMLMLLLQDAMTIGVAQGVERAIGSTHNHQDNRRTVRLVNCVLRDTWGNKEWSEHFVNHIFTFYREKTGG